MDNMKNSMLIKSPDESVLVLADQSTKENPDGEPCTVHHHPETVWNTLQKILPDAREQRLAYLLFHCGLKPKEIIHSCGQEFHDVQEIYHLRYNIMTRLLHSGICVD